MPTPTSKAAIITGNSVVTKAPLIQELEKLLGPQRYALNFTSIKEHSPVLGLKSAAQLVLEDSSIDTLISVGGGSPIDSAKWISIKAREMRGAEGHSDLAADEGYFTHITIPTTLSAGAHAIFSVHERSGPEGRDWRSPAALSGSEFTVAILYDPHYANYTPTRLWLATGLRGLDHAIELIPSALSFNTSGSPNQDKGDGSYTAEDVEVGIQVLLAAFGSLGFLGHNMTGGLGLSHAPGAAYGIPHGEMSCVTLGPVVKLEARGKIKDAEQIARLLPYTTGRGSVWSVVRVGQEKTQESIVKVVLEVGDAVMTLLEDLGLKKTLKDSGVAESEVDGIFARALGGKVGGAVSGIDEKDFEQVKALVKSLY